MAAVGGSGAAGGLQGGCRGVACVLRTSRAFCRTEIVLSQFSVCVPVLGKDGEGRLERLAVGCRTERRNVLQTFGQRRGGGLQINLFGPSRRRSLLETEPTSSSFTPSVSCCSEKGQYNIRPPPSLRTSPGEALFYF